jgi:electron transfer flavoprotein alpha subunit
MKEAEFVISINQDIDSPIIDESDILIRGKIEEVLPLLISELKKYKEKMQIPQEIKQ